MTMSPVLLLFLMHFSMILAVHESYFEGFAPAKIEASMMPTVGVRVDSSEDDNGENHEGYVTLIGEGDQPRMSPIRTLTKLLLMAWIQTVA